MIYFPQRKPDIEVVIKNHRPSKSNMCSGYRPAFKIGNDLLSSGVVKFTTCEELAYGEECVADVWFVTPEFYPNCMKIGDVILFQEGKVVHGSAIITKINNKVLEIDI